MIAIDTNILVYAFQSGSKARKANSLFMSIMEGREHGVVTNQILAEFAYVAGRKSDNPLSAKEINAIIASILRSENWTVYDYDARTVLRAVSARSHFWDALIAQTLLQNGVREILTENVKHFPKLKARNPLRQ